MYKNLLNDEIEIVEKNTKKNTWDFYLRLKEGNRNNYSMVFSDGMIGHNELEFSFEQFEGKWFVQFDIKGSGNGNGTILLKAMLCKIAEFETQNTVKIVLIRGWLSTADRVSRWKKSISFYTNFVNTLDEQTPKNIVSTQLHIKDTSKPLNLGKKVSATDFINGNQDGYIVYIL